MSAVPTDHELHDGPGRRCFLKIEGEETIVFQGAGESVYNSADFNPVFTRAGKVCLHPPEEFTSQLDIGEMRANASAITFILDDIDDTDGKSFWGKRFAPAAWDNSQHWRITAGTAYNQVIDADAVSIPIKSTTGVPGTPVPLYIGRETISYTGTDATGLTGVTKGKWPAVGASEYGYTYPRPQKGEAQYNHAVSQAPFSWLGRLVALYVTTYDRAAKKWNGKGSEELVWVGRISDRIQQRADGTWALSCVSILEDLDRKIGTDFPTAKLAKGINLLGDHGRHFRVEQRSAGALRCYADVTITKAFYTDLKDLVNDINSQLGVDNNNWTDDDGTNPATKRDCLVQFQSEVDKDSGETRCYFLCVLASGTVRAVKIIPDTINHGFCHALHSLGFHGILPVSLEGSSNQTWWDTINGEEIFERYHPIAPSMNGKRLYVDDAYPFWADQGDYPGGTHANIQVEKATFNISDPGKATYSTRYTSWNSDNYFNLHQTYNPGHSGGAYIGSKMGEDAPLIQQVYRPNYQTGCPKRGPFEQLLFIMCSTGTIDYNTVAGTSYDKLPVSLGLTIPERIIDKNSFIEADAAIMFSDLAQRKRMIIDESIAFSELLIRECKLWGYALCWRLGKLTLRPIAQPDKGDCDELLDDSNTSHPEDFLEQDWAAETVVNQYKVIVYDPMTAKKLKPIIVTDMDSRHSLGMAQQVKLDHPGIWVDGKMATVDDLLKDSNSPLLGRIFRFPSPIMARTLGPSLVNKVFVGDIVYLENVKITAADGSGDRTMALLYATAIDVRWNYKIHTGDAVLLLHTHTRNMGSPWCASALVDKSENGGDYTSGWDSVAKTLKLLSREFGVAGDPEDGQAFVYGHAVIIIETSPSDPTNPQKWANTVAGLGYTVATNTLHLTDAMAGWDANTEYVVIGGDYGDASEHQVPNGTWQAAETTELLDGTDLAQKWG